jgi:two-component system chemotaxis response regulator CheY
MASSPLSQTLIMTEHQRRGASMLIVEPVEAERPIAHNAVQALRFGGVSITDTYLNALERFRERRFTHVLFSTADSSMPGPAFVTKLLEYDPRIVAVPCSRDPRTEQVFELLQAGARGFIVKPFTPEMLDLGISHATNGEPISDVVLQARDRNEAFAALIAGCLDRLAVALRQGRQYDGAKREAARLQEALQNTVRLANMFCQGGPERFSKDLETFMIKIGGGPASRLGRLRRKLKTQRKQSPDGDQSTDEESGEE